MTSRRRTGRSSSGYALSTRFDESKNEIIEIKARGYGRKIGARKAENSSHPTEPGGPNKSSKNEAHGVPLKRDDFNETSPGVKGGRREVMTAMSKEETERKLMEGEDAKSAIQQNFDEERKLEEEIDRQDRERSNE